jgi:quercetin dioxygenase-like cupin family protein
VTFRPLVAGETPAAAKVSVEHEHTWEAGQALHIPVHTIHRFAAVTDAVLLEVSTPDLTDVVRLQDDFARPARD